MAASDNAFQHLLHRESATYICPWAKVPHSHINDMFQKFSPVILWMVTAAKRTGYCVNEPTFFGAQFLVFQKKAVYVPGIGSDARRLTTIQFGDNFILSFIILFKFFHLSNGSR